MAKPTATEIVNLLSTSYCEGCDDQGKDEKCFNKCIVTILVSTAYIMDTPQSINSE